MQRFWLSVRIIVPAIWFGIIFGLSFIETPLKFLAPGITTPLGLGIGRLVFTALSIVGVVMLVVLTAAALARPRETRVGWLLIAAMWVLVALETLVIHPALKVRSDIVIAGGDPGESWLHYGYIAAELLLLAVLLTYVIRAVRWALANRPAGQFV